MRDEFQHNRGFNALQSARHITMALLFIAMGFIMFVAKKYNIVQVLAFDELFRKFFGSICFLYGGFRLYRGIKNDG